MPSKNQNKKNMTAASGSKEGKSQVQAEPLATLPVYAKTEGNIDYSAWSHEDLIGRILALEKKLKELKEKKKSTTPQSGSPLLRLPREIRDKIYDFLFRSTRLTFGQNSAGRIRSKTMKPAPHSLALLRVCRQIHEETKSLWLGRVLFNFEQVEALLDKFSALPSVTLSQIRHIRTRGHPLLLSFENDTLTVLGSSDGVVEYDTIRGLIQHGNGWKELRYITHDSTMLGFAKYQIFRGDPYHYCRRPQPSTWNEELLQRDGADSKASVIIYRASENKIRGAVFGAENSREFEQKVLLPGTLEEFAVEEDPRLMSKGKKGKELLVVVKRGLGADIVEREGGPYHAEDIRKWSGSMTWARIKRKHIEFDGKYEYIDDFYFEDEENFEDDSYDAVDGYVWDDMVLF